MKLVYISGPYSAPTQEGVQQNIIRAREYAIQVWKAGHVAICPHLNTALFDIPGIEHDEYIKRDIEIIRRCDAVLLMSGWAESRGAVAEAVAAWNIGVPCFISQAELNKFCAGDPCYGVRVGGDHCMPWLYGVLYNRNVIPEPVMPISLQPNVKPFAFPNLLNVFSNIELQQEEDDDDD